MFAMNSDLTKFVRQAIDCYESDPGVAWVHLENAQDQLIVEKDRHAKHEEKMAAKRSLKRTRKELREMLLEKKGTPLPRQSDLVAANHEDVTPTLEKHKQEAWKRIKERMQKQHFEHILNVITWYENRERGLNSGELITKEEIIKDWGGEAEVLSLEECSDWPEIDRQYELALRREPSFETYLLMKHLDWLDLSAGKINADGPIPFQNSIPDHLRSYIYEARWCSLYEYDAVCAVLCGAILEEAIRIKLTEAKVIITNETTFENLIDAASTTDSGLLAPLLSPNAKRHATDVRLLRNSAVHESSAFATKSEIHRKSSLCLTIELLDTLFTPEV